MIIITSKVIPENLVWFVNFDKFIPKSEERCVFFTPKSEERCVIFTPKSEERCVLFTLKSEEHCVIFTPKSEERCVPFTLKSEERCVLFERIVGSLVGNLYGGIYQLPQCNNQIFRDEFVCNHYHFFKISVQIIEYKFLTPLLYALRYVNFLYLCSVSEVVTCARIVGNMFN